MSTCPYRNELLLLDVYDELDDAKRLEVAKHLQTCADCRQEKNRLEATIGLLKRQMVSSPLTMMESAVLVKGIRQKLSHPRPVQRWMELFLSKREWWIPAAATTCLLVLLTTFIGFERLDVAEGPAGPNLDISMQLPENDMEIIQNLDLLKSFNTLEKLSQVVNDPQGRDAIDLDKQGAQGDKPYGIKHQMA